MSNSQMIDERWYADWRKEIVNGVIEPGDIVASGTARTIMLHTKPYRHDAQKTIPCQGVFIVIARLPFLGRSSWAAKYDDVMLFEPKQRVIGWHHLDPDKPESLIIVQKGNNS